MWVNILEHKYKAGTKNIMPHIIAFSSPLSGELKTRYIPCLLASKPSPFPKHTNIPLTVSAHKIAWVGPQPWFLQRSSCQLAETNCFTGEAQGGQGGGIFYSLCVYICVSSSPSLTWNHAPKCRLFLRAVGNFEVTEWLPTPSFVSIAFFFLLYC